MTMPLNQVLEGDCLAVLPTLPEHSVDLVFGSPPYEDCRSYGIGFQLKGQAWVDWMAQVVQASLRTCRGLVAFVVSDRVQSYRWTAATALLIADLHRAGVCLRRPPIYYRSGIPGSGGPDWLRNDYESVVCCTHGGRLPWSDPTAMGAPPKCKPGGDPTHRLQDGRRVRVAGAPTPYFGADRGDSEQVQKYIPPKIANPGNVIQCAGGHLGSKLAHENEAPFPEDLAEFFIRSFCPPGGVVLDPFAGSGTTCAVAHRTNRRYIGIDIRESQVALSHRRLADTVEAP